MEEEQAAHHLLNVLEERELNVDLDKILLGFEDEHIKQETAAWVDEYLHEETLLTKEELELYQTLKKRGLLHQYENGGEIIRPILDHDITSAIESLQVSTTAIEAQCKILEAQKDALVKLKALDKPNLEAEHARNERRRKVGQEKARLDVAIDDIAVAMTEQLAESYKDVETEKSTIKSYLTERLASDDQILSKLPGIVSKLVTGLDDENEDDKSIDQWCKAIVSFRTSEIKARVDAVYLRNLSEQSSNGHPNVSDEELKGQKAALQAEMEDLHSEIASVAEMVVEHELRKPMNEMKERKEREMTQARRAWLDYVLSTLDYMGKRLDTITTSTKDVNEFQQALVQVSDAASKRLPDTHNVQKTTPSKRRTTSGPLSAFTPLVKLRPTKTLDLPAALQDALRHVGIPFNQDTMESLQDTLLQTQLQQEKKLQDHYESTSTSTHDRLAERTSKADKDTQAITHALYQFTSFRQVCLTNSRLEAQMESVERQVKDGQGALLEAEGNELRLSDPKVKAFIAKYGK
ncbi:hypothetical protein GQ44DRAFT_756929 [Phaeosphaeriaceae sp. PMI808]|nr:hypothetical protein GQ44DRAFT_756929 [Phaeosphaeriaceae sp. PMI808]